MALAALVSETEINKKSLISQQQSRVGPPTFTPQPTTNDKLPFRPFNDIVLLIHVENLARYNHSTSLS